MIILNENEILDGFTIDVNGIIRNTSGEIENTRIHKGYEIFKNQSVHRIMMYTYNGYRDWHKWHIHHLDGNRLNNKLENLVYLTPVEHIRLHNKGRHMSEETKQKLSEYMKSQIGRMKGKHHSSEAKHKMSEAHKGRIWVNNGIISKFIYQNEIPDGFIKGRLK